MGPSTNFLGALNCHAEVQLLCWGDSRERPHEESHGKNMLNPRMENKGAPARPRVPRGPAGGPASSYDLTVSAGRTQRETCPRTSQWNSVNKENRRNNEREGFPRNSVRKESACNAGDLGSIPGSGRSSGGGHGNPLQYSCLENSMDRGVWWAVVRGVTRVRHSLAIKPTMKGLL